MPSPASVPASSLKVDRDNLQVTAADTDQFVTAVQDLHLSPAPVLPSGTPCPPQLWSAVSQQEDRPLFLYDSTVRALGLKSGSVPSLVEAVLGPGHAKVHSDKVYDLFLQPPSKHTALAVASSIRFVFRPIDLDL
jgi:hypothetical protein